MLSRAFVVSATTAFFLVSYTVPDQGFGTGTADTVTPGATWNQAVNPEAFGWSAEKLAEAKAYSRTIGSAAVMIVERGHVIAQWGRIDYPFKLHSIRKPLTSALMGIQVAAGQVDLSASLKDLGIDDNPPGLSEIEKSATVRHLLQSRSGIYHPALGESDGMTAAKPPRHSHAPGTFWYYNNWDFNALGTIFEKLTGEAVCDAFKRQIAAPLRMEDFAVGNCDYQSGSASLHRRYRFRMSARDLARFGLLYLRNGDWDGTRIIPEEWIAESTMAYSSLGNGRGYGYMWGTVNDGQWYPNVTLNGHAFGHSGAGVHFLLVLPGRELVVVHRVDTDGPGPRPAGYLLGRLIWMILDAAGESEIGENPSFDAATGRHITAENVAQVFDSLPLRLSGVRRSGLVEGGSHAYTTELAEDGAVTISVAGQIVDSGIWWMDGSLFGFRLERATRGQPQTRYAVASEGRIRFYDPGTGSLAFTLFRIDE